MKKVVTVIFITLLAAVFLVGCIPTSNRYDNSATAKDDEWIEIQSVTYYTNASDFPDSQKVSHVYTISSSVYVEKADIEEITEDQYRNASEDEKAKSITFGSSFSVNRKADIKHLQNSINKTFVYTGDYYYDADGYHLRCYKATVKSYEIHYAKIRFVDSNTFELNYYKNTEYITIRVKPLSYVVSYFND